MAPKQLLSARALVVLGSLVLSSEAAHGDLSKSSLVRSARRGASAILTPDGDVLARETEALEDGDVEKPAPAALREEKQEVKEEVKQTGSVERSSDLSTLAKYTKYPHDCPGENLMEFAPGAKTEAQCATACDGIDTCTGFSYSASGQCYPKDMEPCELNLGKTEPDYKFYSKTRPKNMKKGTFLQEDAKAQDDQKTLAAYTAYTHDCPGANILELAVGKASKTGCAVYCDNDATCKGFTYSDKGACYLKGEACAWNKEKVETSFIFYSKGKPMRVLSEDSLQELQVENQFEMEGFTKYTHDCPGVNLAEYSAGTKTKGQCADICRTDNECAGFTYSATGACYSRKDACRWDKDRHDGAEYVFFSKGPPGASL